MGGAAFLGPGVGGTPDAIANALSAAGGLNGARLVTLGADVALPIAGVNIITSSFTLPVLPTTNWRVTVRAFCELQDSVASDTARLTLSINGSSVTDATLDLPLASPNGQLYVESLALLAAGTIVSVVLHGLSSAAHITAKALSGAGNPTTQLVIDVLPGALF